VRLIGLHILAPEKIVDVHQVSGQPVKIQRQPVSNGASGHLRAESVTIIGGIRIGLILYSRTNCVTPKDMGSVGWRLPDRKTASIYYQVIWLCFSNPERLLTIGYSLN